MCLLLGAFGRVFKGILQREHADGEQSKTLQVAIKTIKSECQHMTTHDAIVFQFITIVDACTHALTNKHTIKDILYTHTHPMQPCPQAHFQLFSIPVIQYETESWGLVLRLHTPMTLYTHSTHTLSHANTHTQTPRGCTVS